MTLHISLSDIAVFLAIFLRLSIMVFMLPPFSSTQVPAAFKACTTVALTTMLYPLLRETVAALQFEVFALLLVVLGEVIFAILFALSMLLILGAVEVAGELIGFQMGFGFAQVADPQNGAQTTIISMWLQLFAILVFFGLNGHHILLATIVQSFRTVPLGAFTLNPGLESKIILLSGHLFVIAIKMAAPVMIVLLLIQFGLGLMSKFAPQINILMTSFPLTILVGVCFMILSLPIWGNSMESAFKDLFLLFQQVLARK